MTAPQTQRSVPEVLQDVVGNLQMIIRSEFRLAKTELQEELDKMAKPAAVFGAGLALGFYALGCLILASIYALTTVMAGWLAALLIGTVLTVFAIALANSGGTRLKKLRATPQKTIQSLEENVQWAKDQIK